MKRILQAAVLSFALGGFVLTIPEAGQAAAVCTTVSAKAAGYHKATVAKRAERRVKWRINRWARKQHTKVVYVGLKHTKCTKGKYHLHHCTAYAKACKK